MRKRVTLAIATLLSTAVLVTSAFRRGSSQPGEQIGSGKLELKLLASVPINNRKWPLESFVQVKDRVLYISDGDAKRIGKVFWESPTEIRWIVVSSTTCPSLGGDIQQTEILTELPYLLVSHCEKVEVIDKATLTHVGTLVAYGDGKLRGPYSFALSPDQRLLAVAINVSAERDRIKIFRTDDWAVVGEWDGDLRGGFQFSPDSKYLVTTFSDNPDPHARLASECGVAFYDIFSGKKVHEWSRSTKSPPCPGSPFEFVPGNSHRIVCRNFEGGGLAEWDAKNGKLIRRLEYQGHSLPNWLSISHDGKIVAADLMWPEGIRPDKLLLRIWDLATGRAVYQIPLKSFDRANTLYGARFSREGNYVVLTWADRVELYQYTLRQSHDRQPR